MQKNIYRAAPGVDEVNGQPVPVSGRVSLTETEALYDLAHGRIAEEPVVARRQRKPLGSKP